MTGTEIIAFLAGNVDKVTTAIGSVAGAIFTAIFLRNNTATEEFEKVKAGMLQEVAEDLLQSGKMTYTEFYKAKNFLRVAELADEEYAQIPHEEREETSGTYDFDWFVRFYEAVGNISDEKMQHIWAKILAGEINNPNTYSLRTIDVLKNLSKKDAEVFNKVCSHCICMGKHLFLPHYDNYMNQCQVSFSDVMHLDEVGLLRSDSLLILELEINPSPQLLLYNDSLLITAATTDGKTRQFKIKQFPMTEVGDELSTLIGERISNEDFISFAKELNEDKTAKICVHRILLTEGDTVHFRKSEDLLEV